MNIRIGAFDAQRIVDEILDRLEEHKGEKVNSREDLFNLLFEYENTHDSWYETDAGINAKEDINDDRYYFCAIATRYYCKWGEFTSFADDVVKFHCEMMCFTYFYIINFIGGFFCPGHRFTIDDSIIENFKLYAEEFGDRLIDDYDIWAP